MALSMLAGACSGLLISAPTAASLATPPPVRVPRGQPGEAQLNPLGPTPLQPDDPTPSTTPPPALIRLTRNACCAGPEWSADSTSVRFVGRPDENAAVGMYALSLETGKAVLVRKAPGVYSEGDRFLVSPSGDRVIVERLADGKRWTVATQGFRVWFSPSGERIAWGVGSRTVAFLDLVRQTVRVAAFDGSGARNLVTVIGGGFLGWAEDDSALLVSGRLDAAGPAGIWRVSLADGAARLIVEADRVEGALRSPSGAWLAYIVAFADDPSQDGLWVLRTDGAALRKLDLFGAYRWRGGDSLLVVPLSLETDPSVWEVEAGGGEERRLTDPNLTPLPIANNDWAVSPDGRWMVFRSSEDGNLWLLLLPD